MWGIDETPPWWIRYVSAAIAVGAVLAVGYILARLALWAASSVA